MGCRLLSFLEKLRRKFIIRKTQCKRERDEKPEKGDESSTVKRPKVTDDSEQKQTSNPGKKDTTDQSHDETVGEGAYAADQDEAQIENRSGDNNDDVQDEEENKSDDNQNDKGEEEEEDPEEIIKDDQEMNDVAPSDDRAQDDENTAKTVDLKYEPEKATAVEDNGGKKAMNEMNSKRKDDDTRAETAKSDSVKEKEDIIDKEVLQAFRYFDHNRAGYIKVEDLRCLLHNLGKFLSHRDVKELVQTALFESSTARDNLIFYKKLVKLTNI